MEGVFVHAGQTIGISGDEYNETAGRACLMEETA